MLLQEALANCLIYVEIKLLHDNFESILRLGLRYRFKFLIILKHFKHTVHKLLQAELIQVVHA